METQVRASRISSLLLAGKERWRQDKTHHLDWHLLVWKNESQNVNYGVLGSSHQQWKQQRTYSLESRGSKPSVLALLSRSGIVGWIAVYFDRPKGDSSRWDSAFSWELSSIGLGGFSAMLEFKKQNLSDNFFIKFDCDSSRSQGISTTSIWIFTA